jgi:hypothetical protein
MLIQLHKQKYVKSFLQYRVRILQLEHHDNFNPKVSIIFQIFI